MNQVINSLMWMIWMMWMWSEFTMHYAGKMASTDTYPLKKILKANVEV
jgi:hypothetical protein